ncbi:MULTISPECIES: hypothetical protein [Aeromicrobium]|uniref:hypothetical protein n=1 Tax=Aeromicrobium TaxID=2040 RepID=UPI0006F67ED6|nr:MULTISPECIES: hypothetical protein [Aeromicrobium]KQX76332.1 hypothetical protein ASD10_14765 [Aeromicrobium sp. Root472D3]MCL8253284.1 hypothetical protein [Aeromicrobium fastidiosum]
MSQPHDDLDVPDRDVTGHDLPATPTTGHAAIDEALERLSRIDDLDLSLHPEEFDAVHGVLRESLANAGRDGVAPESA